MTPTGPKSKTNPWNPQLISSEVKRVKAITKTGYFFRWLKQLSGWQRQSDKRDKNKRQNNKLADHENPKWRCGSLKSERKCDDNALIEHKKGPATGWVRVKGYSYSYRTGNIK